MSTENLAVDTGDVGPSFSADEEAFFTSGGEGTIPDDAAGDTGADSTVVDDKAPILPEKGADGKGADKTPQNVPLAALHEERSKRKELGGKVTEQEKQIAELNGKLSILLKLKGGEGADGAADQTAVVPTAEEDIFGNVKHVGETVAQLQKRLDDADAATKATNEQTTFVNSYRADADTFKAKTADYMDAYNHLLGSRASELLAIGFADPKALADSGADPAEVQAAAKALHDALVADEFAIAQRAFAAKKSPAEIIYNLAKQRGYAKKAAAGDGKKPGEQVLESIERGQQTNKSLDAVGGSPGGEDMTAERLLAMPLPEFEAWASKNPAKAKRIMGG